MRSAADGLRSARGDGACCFPGDRSARHPSIHGRAAAQAARIARAIADAGLPNSIGSLGLICSGQTLADHMLHDKKMDAGTLPFILLRAIGDAFLARDVDMADIASFLDEQLRSG